MLWQPLALQVQKYRRQLFCPQETSFAVPTKLVILAEYAAEITVSRKNRTRTAGSAKTSFLSEMRSVATDTAMPPRSAD